MIIRKEDVEVFEKQNLQNGQGTVAIHNLLPDPPAHIRLLNRLEMQPGTSVGEHGHQNEIEIYYLLEGELQLDEDGVRTVLKQGDIHVFNKDSRKHTIKNDGDVKCAFIALIVTD